MTPSTFYPLILKGVNLPWEDAAKYGTKVTLPSKKIISNSSSSPQYAPGFYMIRKGFVRLSHISREGHERILLYFSDGCIFNENPAIIAGKEYLFTVLEPTEAYFWPGKTLSEKFISEHPGLMFNLLQSVSYKTVCFFSQLCAIGTGDTFTNTCRLLYSMYLFNKEKGRIVPRLSLQEVSAFLGVHRSSVHKALSFLIKEKIIESYSKKELVVLNDKELLYYTRHGDY